MKTLDEKIEQMKNDVPTVLFNQEVIELNMRGYVLRWHFEKILQTKIVQKKYWIENNESTKTEG